MCLVAAALSLGTGACFAQNVRAIDVLPGFASDSPQPSPTSELPAIDVLESVEDSEDAAHKDSRRVLATECFEFRFVPSLIRSTGRQPTEHIISRPATGSFHARGPPALA